jgi:hypothetical protein
VAVRIDISDTGHLQIMVDGKALMLVDTVVVTAQGNERPHVSIAFFDTKKMVDVQLRLRYDLLLKEFEHTARGNPFVEVLNSSDTLPSSGMVIPEKFSR